MVGIIHNAQLTPGERAAREAQWDTERAERAALQAEVDAEKAAERAQWDRQAEAQTHCQSEVQRRAKFPSEIEFPFLDNDTYKDNGARAIVVGRAKLMNSFGAKIPHIFKCVFAIENGKLTALRDFNLAEG